MVFKLPPLGTLLKLITPTPGNNIVVLGLIVVGIVVATGGGSGTLLRGGGIALMDGALVGAGRGLMMTGALSGFGYAATAISAALLAAFLGGVVDDAFLAEQRGGGCLSLSSQSSSSLLLVADRSSSDEMDELLDEGASSSVAESVDHSDCSLSFGFLFFTRAGLEDGSFFLVVAMERGAVFILSEDVESSKVLDLTAVDLRPLTFTTPGEDNNSTASPFLSFLALAICLFKYSWVSCCLLALDTRRDVMLNGLVFVKYDLNDVALGRKTFSI